MSATNLRDHPDFDPSDPAWRVTERIVRQEAERRTAAENALERFADALASYEALPSVRLVRFFDKAVLQIQDGLRKAFRMLRGGC